MEIAGEVEGVEPGYEQHAETGLILWIEGLPFTHQAFPL